MEVAETPPFILACCRNDENPVPASTVVNVILGQQTRTLGPRLDALADADSKSSLDSATIGIDNRVKLEARLRQREFHILACCRNDENPVPASTVVNVILGQQTRTLGPRNGPRSVSTTASSSKLVCVSVSSTFVSAARVFRGLANNAALVATMRAILPLSFGGLHSVRTRTRMASVSRYDRYRQPRQARSSSASA
jgi:hypothetical protein